MMPFRLFYDTVRYAYDKQHLHTVLYDLENALSNHEMLHNLMVNDNGSVTYFPRIKDRLITKPRTTSLTRLAIYLSQAYPFMAANNWQPLQDEIVKWAAAEMGAGRWKFEEVSGPDVIEAYRNGPRSCMRGRTAQLQLYAVNPEKVSLLKVIDNGVYVARALVWTADDGKRYVDRVYPNNARLGATVRGHAARMGWIARRSDSVTHNNYDDRVSITLKHVTNRRLPYLDSMMYLAELSQESLTLTNKYEDERRNSNISVGSYTGLASIYSPVKYVDGTPVIMEIIGSNTSYGKRLSVPANVHTVRIMRARGNGNELVALRSTDFLYVLPGQVYPVRPTAYITATDGNIYLKKDTRKRRGVPEYVPKPDVTGYKVTHTTTLQNGSQLKTLEAL